jgi:hypothetical protein
LREVGEDLDLELSMTLFTRPRLQGIQRRNEDWARAHPLDRDDCIRVDLMSKLGFSDSEIVREFEEKKWTIRQVQYVRIQLNYTPTSRRNHRGPLLRTSYCKKIIDWIKESPSYRLVKWEDIPGLVDVGIPYGLVALKQAMRTEGYGRRVLRIRPLILDKVRQ